MQVSKCAKVHGLVTFQSPMKSNTAGTTKYFQGQLSDEKRGCRVVGCDTKVHRKLQEFRETKQPVAVDNCEVKEGRGGGGLEVVIRNSSAVHKSPSKYSVKDTVFSSCGAEVSLSDILSLANFEKVSVRLKVMIVKEAQTVNKGLVKQDCTVLFH